MSSFDLQTCARWQHTARTPTPDSAPSLRRRSSSSIVAHLPRPSVLRRPRQVACGNGGMAPPDELPLQRVQRGAQPPGQLEFEP
jgi:hypothetical protein